MWRKAKSYYVSVVIITMLLLFGKRGTNTKAKYNADRKQEYPFLGVLSICDCMHWRNKYNDMVYIFTYITWQQNFNPTTLKFLCLFIS